MNYGEPKLMRFETVCDKTLYILKAEDNAAYERILAEASGVINSNSIFWKVEKEGQKPSWLFGTMHMADPEIAT